MKLTAPLLPASIRPQAPRLLRALALLAIAGGIGVWGALLLAPRPDPAPARLAQDPPAEQAPQAVIAWFGSGQGQLNVKILGLMAGGPQGIALLSIDQGPARAYRLGDTLAPGATLDAIGADGIRIGLDGGLQQVPAPVAPPAPAGFVPATVAPD
ncbi:type II secretion system protein N [Castellaniella hirudinis]|uniref:type II secretion system protein N n=1 Tax=Castellaniella hirudinis TaxID=1144617 RepID=UPI0039C28C97